MKNILLSEYTTIGLGGKAKLFLKCKSINEITDALKYSDENNLNVQVFSGGSNIIFPDNGFDGIILKIDLKGIEFSEEGNLIYANVSAGENWDDFVKIIIDKNLAGIECLSCIPGSTGAVPIQNVGAYGQEVGETICSVEAIEISSLKTISFTNSECNFEYRSSRFKNSDKDKYIITKVAFVFDKNKQTEIKYPELQKYIDLHSGENENNSLAKIRESVLSLRKSKSMLIDVNDPNSKSCGSFFLNPVLNETDFNRFKTNTEKYDAEVPVYKSGNNYKISAAWLVEKAGFKKGFTKGGVGISKNHSLSIININGSADELLSLAEEIRKRVYKKFRIQLENEPVIV